MIFKVIGGSPMAEIISTISKLMTEHEEIRESLNTCQISASDLDLTEKVETAGEIINPGRLENHRQKAIQLEKELMTIEENLRNHFKCEEQSLLEDFRERKVGKLVAILGELIVEHEGILHILADLRKKVADLAVSQASVASWQDSAWRIRPLLLQLADTIKSHASREDLLYHEARELVVGHDGSKN
jgi:iron-sulfur cluster repair protein YtfE (RIC family)